MKVTANKQAIVDAIVSPSVIEEKAKAALGAAGCSKYWYDVNFGMEVFEVERMPVNSPLLGLIWEEVI